MLFNSFEFLIFFPVVTVLFFILPHKYRWLLLLIASCIFYMYFIPIYILILAGTIIIDYIAGIQIEKAQGKKRKLYLIISLVANIGILAVFKYYNFFIGNLDRFGDFSFPLLKIILPIGLSFHTFQAMSYTIEVYRGKQKAERHFGIYSLYVMFYPQLVAGPIERPQNILHQFHEKKYFNYDNVTSGLRLMMWGLFKKVVIADRLATFTDPVFNNPHDYSGLTLGLAAVFFSYQILCDFSGYSDIAIGAARVMGFRLMKNFNNPYHSKSVAEFWNRWHISLSTWFKDYLFIPLGGNRVSMHRAYLNIFIVFLVSGLWHGANWTFVLFGAMHGVYLVIGHITKKRRKKLANSIGITKIVWLNNATNILTVYFLVLLSQIVFRANSLHDVSYIFYKIAGIPYELNQMVFEHNTSLLKFPMDNSLILLSFGLIAFLELIQTIQVKYNFNIVLQEWHVFYRWTFYYSSIAVIYFLGVFEQHQFIYFQF
ncbi:MAG: MBOAT family O-acyltransferase [Ilyomonas sp.]